ncbi:MAG: hypothetical protein ACRDPL_15310, partial [Propionibacteriaceae bacterium]
GTLDQDLPKAEGVDAEINHLADGGFRSDDSGSWFAWPSTHVGHELIGAGMLILAGDGRGLPFDYDEFERWTRVGFERGMASRRGER